MWPGPGRPASVAPLYPRWYHALRAFIIFFIINLLFSDVSSFPWNPSPYQNPRSDPEGPWSNHFPRLLVFNTQCIIKQIPHPDRKKIEQLIRLELSQFMAKLKRLPTMDKSRRGRKSMTGRTGVSPRFSRSARRWESVAGSCLIYTWFFLSFLNILLRDFVKQWALSGMEGQCHRVRSYPSSSALISQSPVLSGFMGCLINSVYYPIPLSCIFTGSASCFRIQNFRKILQEIKCPTFFLFFFFASSFGCFAEQVHWDKEQTCKIVDIIFNWSVFVYKNERKLLIWKGDDEKEKSAFVGEAAVEIYWEGTPLLGVRKLYSKYGFLLVHIDLSWRR